MRIISALLLSLLILSAAAYLRPPEYDEAYSIFLTAGDPRPAWPPGIFHPGDVRHFYRGNPSLLKIDRDLRKTDVHPPLYFWLLEYWRRLFGPSWFAARLLSVLFTLGALAGIAWIAALTEIPIASAMLFALLSYGFAYTGIVARGFALAQFLNILGMALILSATRNRAKPLVLAAGLAFGAACFTNYLAVFIALATFLCAALQRRRLEILLPAAIGFLAILPAPLFFFLAQRNSRLGQFDRFSPPHAIFLLTKDSGAALFGGLPLYAGHAGGIITSLLITLIAICTCFIVKNWQPKLALFAVATLSVPTGLFALGLIFNNTPIEIRYLAFAIPTLALLLAQTLPPALRIIVLAIQACGIIGLILAPATMQPQGIAARQVATLNRPAALVLLPFGNDGVGIPGPFIEAAPNNLNLELIKPGVQPGFSNQQTIILVPIRIDDSSTKASAELLATLTANPCFIRQQSLPLAIAFIRTCKAH